MKLPLDPRDSHLDDLLGQVADDFLRRCHRGEKPQIEDYARRHPALAGILRQMLPTLQALATGSSTVAEETAEHILTLPDDNGDRIAPRKK